MLTVGAFEAKTHLSALLEKVSRGEQVLITRHGKAVARLVPAEQADRSKTAAAIESLTSMRKEVQLGGIGWRTLRDEGRR